MGEDERDGAGWDAPLPVGPASRHERARLARADREARRARGERTRERVTRDRTRPWAEGDAPGLRRRVWAERRDEEWAVAALRADLPPEPDDA